MKKRKLFNLFFYLCIFSFINFIVLSILDVYLEGNFKPLEYAGGLGAVLAAVGVGIGIKKSMENDK